MNTFIHQDLSNSHLLKVADYIRESREENAVLGGHAKSFVFNLLCMHPGKKDRVHLVEKFRIVRHFGQKTVQLELSDGTTELLSLRKCLLSRKRYDREALLRAMRVEITEQIDHFKNRPENSGVLCLSCQEEIANHVDHDSPPFVHLAWNFISDKLYGVKPEVHTAAHPTLRTQTWRLKDPKVAEKWHTYHRENAVLQMLCGLCNMRKGVE